MKLRKLLLLFIIQPFILFAQSQEVDSLLSIIKSEKNDTTKARVFNAIHNKLIRADDRAGIFYNKMALNHVTRMKWEKGRGVFYGNIGECFSNLGLYDSALYYFRMAEKSNLLAKEYNNLISNTINMSVAAQNIKADYVKAAELLFKALELSEKYQIPNHKPILYANIASLYLIQSNYQKCILYASEGIAASRKLGDSNTEAILYKTLSKTYYQLRDYQKASDNLEHAIGLFNEQENSLELADCYSTMALLQLNNYQRIIELRKKAMHLFNEGNSSHPNALTNKGNLGVALLDAVRYDTFKNKTLSNQEKKKYLSEASIFFQETINEADKIGNDDDKFYYTGCLAELQALNGNYKDAYLNFRLYQDYQDSTFSQAHKNEIAALENKRIVDSKNAEIRNKHASIKNRNYLLAALAAIALILSYLIYLISKQNKINKENNKTLQTLNQELENANLLKAKFLSIIAHDFRAPMARLISFLNIQKTMPGVLNEEERRKIDETIYSSTSALLTNMESLLVWSKSNLTGFVLTPTEFNLYDFFYEQKESFYASENIYIQVPKNQIVFIDKNILTIILQNLTQNALKNFDSFESAKILWQSKIQESDFVIYVKDNGPGFPDSMLSQLNKLKLDAAHNGYGWQIIQDLASLSNIKIVCYNDQGAVVELHLPKQN